jgi:hypothetical protein
MAVCIYQTVFVMCRYFTAESHCRSMTDMVIQTRCLYFGRVISSTAGFISFHLVLSSHCQATKVLFLVHPLKHFILFLTLLLVHNLFSFPVLPSFFMSALLTDIHSISF